MFHTVLVYINDIVFTKRLFADVKSIYIIVENPVIAAKILNADLKKVVGYF